MATTEHDLCLEQDFLRDGVTAVCSCGWAKETDSQDDALEAWENHCDVVFMEATGG